MLLCSGHSHQRNKCITLQLVWLTIKSSIVATLLFCAQIGGLILISLLFYLSSSGSLASFHGTLMDILFMFFPALHFVFTLPPNFVLLVMRIDAMERKGEVLNATNIEHIGTVHGLRVYLFSVLLFMALFPTSILALFIILFVTPFFLPVAAYAGIYAIKGLAKIMEKK